MWSPDLFDKCMAASFPSSDGADNLIKSGGVVLLLWGQSIKAGQLTLINYIYISIIDEENTLQLSGNQKLWSLSINSHVHYWFISRPISHPGKPGKSLLTNIANMADAFQQIWQPPSSKYGSCLPANMADAFQQIWLMLSSKYGWCLPANMADAFQQIWDMPSSSLEEPGSLSVVLLSHLPPLHFLTGENRHYNFSVLSSISFSRFTVNATSLPSEASLKWPRFAPKH